MLSLPSAIEVAGLWRLVYLPGGIQPEAGLGWLLLLRGPGFYAVAVGMFTFLFTDIEGSTALLQRAGEDVYAQVLADHHGLIRSALAVHGGTELNTLGDGFFAGFSSPRACVAAALDM